jgi:hypothetical protein
LPAEPTTHSLVAHVNERTTAMAENKTKPTDASVDDCIASRANSQQEADCGPFLS